MCRAGMGLLALASLMPLPAAAARGCGPAMVQLVVLDQGGSSIPGLTPSDFRVRIKGQGTTVKAVDYGLFPHRTLLLLSRTASMGQSLKLEMARQLANSVVSGAPGPVMNGSFASEVSTLTDARTEPIAGAIQPSTDARNTIYDAVNADMIVASLHRGDWVVVITDSADNGSRSTAAELQQRFAANGARLFVLALPSAGTTAMQPLSDLAESTGGGLIVPLRLDPGAAITPGQIEASAGVVSRTLAQYNNIYQLETDVDGQDRAMPLKVEVDRHKIGAGRVVAPTMLAPCTAVGP